MEEAAFRIALINMPFSRVDLPSIALTQLKSVLENRLPGRIDVNIIYLNHDFAQSLGIERYAEIGNNVMATSSGLGDWLFRFAAFPDIEDNSKIYFRRYSRTLGFREGALEKLQEKYRVIELYLDELIDKYSLHEYSMVGFTSMFAQNVASFSMARKIKDRNSNIVTVMGGANCETCMGQTIAKNVDVVDFVFSGPALKSFPRLVQCLVENNASGCHEIKGVYSREKLARQGMNGSDEIGEDMDIDACVSLDYADYLASLNKHFPGGELNPSLLFETSRGCWWGERVHCAFCGLNATTMNYRTMNVDHAIGLFKKLFEYAPQVTSYKSVDNNMPKNFIAEVFPNLEPPAGSTIFYEVKTDLKKTDMEVLANSGITEIQPGIEALSTSNLKLMKKGSTSFQNIRFLKNCLIYDIKPRWNLLLGVPGEGEDVDAKYVDDLPLLVHLPPPMGAYPIRFDRFSPYFIHAKEYGLDLKPLCFYELVYPFSSDDLNHLAYFFEDQNYNAPYIQLTVNWFRKIQERIGHWRTRYYRQDNLHKPSLEFFRDGNSRVIRDSRSETIENYEISDTGMKILEMLDSPKTPARLARLLGELDEREVEVEIECLHKHKLLFQDGASYLSLVVESGRECISI